MKRPVTVVVRWIALVWLAGMVIAANGPSFSQEPAAGQPAASGKKAGRGSADKPSSRLPMYYAKVVNKEQREKILSIQKDFAAKIDPLRKQLDALTKDRDAEMAAVLTPEQREKIDEMKAAAKKKTRDAKKTAKDKPAAGAVEEKPAGKEKE
jgi:hypothetical protein